MPSTASLPIALQGPMMTYATSTHERQKSTSLIPTKRAVLGMVAACLGRTREEGMDDLNRLRFHLRVDSPGHVMADFQTSQGAVRANGEILSTPSLLRREYLVSAAFLVVLSGDEDMITRIARAIRAPVFQPYLGTRPCLPARPLYAGEMQRTSAEHLLSTVPLISGEPGPRTAYSEDPSGPTVLQDATADPPARLMRRTQRRHVRVHTVHPPTGGVIMPSVRL